MFQSLEKLPQVSPVDNERVMKTLAELEPPDPSSHVEQMDLTSEDPSKYFDFLTVIKDENGNRNWLVHNLFENLDSETGYLSRPERLRYAEIPVDSNWHAWRAAIFEVFPYYAIARKMEFGGCRVCDDLKSAINDISNRMYIDQFTNGVTVNEVIPTVSKIITELRKPDVQNYLRAKLALTVYGYIESHNAHAKIGQALTLRFPKNLIEQSIYREHPDLGFEVNIPRLMYNLAIDALPETGHLPQLLINESQYIEMVLPIYRDGEADPGSAYAPIHDF